MGVIRFNDDEVFTTDSHEYEILQAATFNVRDVEGAIVEIGTRRGGSAKLIIDSIVASGNTNRTMFCIDPYGNIDYVQTNKALKHHHPDVVLEGDPTSTEITQPTKLDYDNNMRNRTIPSLYYYAYQRITNFTFFCLEDTEFFNRYANGVPVYNNEKSIVNKYALVFFDGPHTSEKIEEETMFFVERSNVGSIFVYDDIWMYDHEKIENIIANYGFELLEKKNIKASYIKKS
jgi:hypothetical protein